MEYIHFLHRDIFNRPLFIIAHYHFTDLANSDFSTKWHATPAISHENKPRWDGQQIVIASNSTWSLQVEARCCVSLPTHSGFLACVWTGGTKRPRALSWQPNVKLSSAHHWQQLPQYMQILQGNMHHTFQIASYQDLVFHITCPSNHLKTRIRC